MNIEESSKMTNILNDKQSVHTYTSRRTALTLGKVEDRNPYQFIEKALVNAKEKLTKMKNNKNFVDSLTDNGKKKTYLKNENKQLRDQLKGMSDNVNALITKMNQETLKKKKGKPDDGRSGSKGSIRIRAAD